MTVGAGRRAPAITVSNPGAPTGVRSLEQRIRTLDGGDGLARRRRVGMASVVVGQMLG